MNVGELILLLSQLDKSLPVLLSIGEEGFYYIAPENIQPTNFVVHVDEYGPREFRGTDIWVGPLPDSYQSKSKPAILIGPE